MDIHVPGGVDMRGRETYWKLWNSLIQPFNKLLSRSNANTLDKTKKAIVTYFLNSEREKKKEEERKERERMQKLREEDEEGYRKLLDETKVRGLL